MYPFPLGNFNNLSPSALVLVGSNFALRQDGVWLNSGNANERFLFKRGNRCFFSRTNGANDDILITRDANAGMVSADLSYMKPSYITGANNPHIQAMCWDGQKYVTTTFQGAAYLSADLTTTTFSPVLYADSAYYPVLPTICSNGLGTLVAVSSQSGGTKFITSTNYGSSWTTITPPGIIGSSQIAIDHVKWCPLVGKFFAHDSNADKLLYSSDGLSWFLGATTYGAVFRVVGESTGRVWAGTYAGSLKYTTDNGTTWNSVTINSPWSGSEVPFDIATYGGNLYLVSAYVGAAGAKIFKSTDNGNNWNLDFTASGSGDLPIRIQA